jgi:LmbE family N-acetylglucosaminyl deacetylase
MLSLTFGRSARAPLTVLCIGAHADDLEIGCAGTLLELLRVRANVSVHWVVLSGDSVRAAEAGRSARRLLRRARSRQIVQERFRDAFFPSAVEALKQRFEQLKTEVRPDVIFSHHLEDRHQDHRLVSELTWNTFRDHLILEYEIPKYDGDLGHPNVFIPLEERTRRQKIRLLMSAFRSQAGRPWFSPATFDALMRLRGVECGAPEGYAEAFHARKAVLRPSHG